MSNHGRIFLALTIATSACAFLNDGTTYAQTVRRPDKPVADLCEIGDIERMSASSPAKIDYAGTWLLDESGSDGLPALWWSASSITMVITQDANRLTPVLTVTVGAKPMVYTGYSYPLDGRTDYSRDGQSEVVSDLRYADGGRSVVLRSTDFAQVKDVELVHETTQRWELAEGGRVLRVCRRLEGPLTRTVSNLLFTRK